MALNEVSMGRWVGEKLFPHLQKENRSKCDRDELVVSCVFEMRPEIRGPHENLQTPHRRVFRLKSQLPLVRRQLHSDISVIS